MLITFYDSYSVLTKVYSNGAFLKQALSDTVVRESSRAHLNKICYGVLDKDITLSYVIEKLCNKAPKQAIKTILKIGLYSIIYLKTAPYAVTDTCVELSKKLGKGGASGFINAVLRNYIRNGVDFELDGVKGLSIKYSYPEFLINLLIKDYGLNLTEQIISSDSENTFIRFNSGIDGENYLTKRNINYQITPFSDTFLVKNFKMDEDFKKGIYTFQSIGSVAICNMVGIGKRLLDCCSAPGGKSVFLSDKFDSVVSFELHSHRAELIKSYVKRMGKTNVEVFVKDSSILDTNYVESFDTILCDAPCSGTGVIKDNPDIKLNRDSNSIKELNAVQFAILNNIKNYLKKGGTLCYSTCSILKDENDKIIDKFLKENKNFKVLEVNSELPHIKTEYGLSFMPHISMQAGFYFCKLKRVD